MTRKHTRKHSEATRRKMSQSHTGKVLPEETKRKISASMVKYWEEKKQIVEALKRAGFSTKYYTHTEEAKQKMREAARNRSMAKAHKALKEKRELEREEKELLKLWDQNR